MNRLPDKGPGAPKGDQGRPRAVSQPGHPPDLLHGQLFRTTRAMLGSMWWCGAVVQCECARHECAQRECARRESCGVSACGVSAGANAKLLWADSRPAPHRTTPHHTTPHHTTPHHTTPHHTAPHHTITPTKDGDVALGELRGHVVRLESRRERLEGEAA